MTVVNVSRTTWTNVNSAAKRVQVFGGRVKIAESDTPTDKDWQVWPEGAVVDVTAVKYAQAVDDSTTWLVVQNL